MGENIAHLYTYCRLKPSRDLYDWTMFSQSLTRKSNFRCFFRVPDHVISDASMLHGLEIWFFFADSVDTTWIGAYCMEATSRVWSMSFFTYGDSNSAPSSMPVSTRTLCSMPVLETSFCGPEDRSSRHYEPPDPTTDLFRSIYHDFLHDHVRLNGQVIFFTLSGTLHCHVSIFQDRLVSSEPYHFPMLGDIGWLAVTL